MLSCLEYEIQIEFCNRAKYYQEDSATEKRNYEVYAKLLGV
nr:MAG TPA: hypothetical protein [Caudoviricetes sp.]